MMTRVVWRLWFATLLLCAWLVCGVSYASAAAPRTWYVRASVTGGDGSMSKPFGTLAAVEQAAGPGDTIEVLPSRASMPLLNDGIALKPGQKLLGAGPSVIGVSASAPAPRIENTSPAQNSGNAVVLADDVEVSNIAVVGAYLGGIYGNNVKDVSVHGNDVTATNTSCTTGFVVQPFNLPTATPGVGVPFAAGLPNGWASIMVDESHTTTNVTIDGNFVHDGTCSDGIDIRASGTADITAQVDGNTVTRLRQDPNKSSELAIGMQAIDTSQLVATVERNSESYIGTATVGDFGDSDSEGLFENTAGHSHLIENVDHNTFSHGLGHLSANCVEMAASNGTPTETMTLSNSTCDTVVGDIIEAANLANGALNLTVDHVNASHATYAGAQAQAPVEPGDDGDCLLAVTSGSASTTSVHIENSKFTDCAGDGLGVISNNVNGGPPIKAVSFDVQNSQINNNQLSNLRVDSASEVQQLNGRIENTDLSRSAGSSVILQNPYDVSTVGTNLDLGGGGLASTGHNCIYDGAQTDVTALGYSLQAQHNWWGDPAGPPAGSTPAVNGTITDNPVLTQNTCGPTGPTGPTTPPGPTTPLPATLLGPTAPPGCPQATGRLSGNRLGLVTLGLTRAQTRRAYKHSSNRGRRYQDFFCLTPTGVRVGYASPMLLRTLPRAQRKRLSGRVIWASTSNRFYTIRGVRPGATLAAARMQLKLTRPFHIGLNFWYLASNGSSTAVLKVRHGILEEIGIGDKQITPNHRADLTFLKSFS